MSHARLTVLQADAITGPPCKASKMPGLGTTSATCNVGALLTGIKGSVCHACYFTNVLKGTFRGFFATPDSVKAIKRRIKALDKAMATPKARQKWVDAMVSRFSRQTYVRWSVGGDLANLQHFTMICDVCDETPHVNHWLPTKEYGLMSKVRKSGYPIPPNLIIRVSAPMVGQHIKGEHTSAVNCFDADVHQCPAPEQEGECNDCRACWDHDVECVSYKQH